MMIRLDKTALVAGMLLSLAGFSSAALAAEPTFGTGGYNRELRTLDMMKMLDANGDHMVSGDEFTKYYGTLFDELDTNHDGAADSKEWVGTRGSNQISVATGGYSRELRSMAMMKAMDTDKDHKVTRDEFIKYHETIFTALDSKGQGMIDAEGWLRKTTGR